MRFMKVFVVFLALNVSGNVLAGEISSDVLAEELNVIEGFARDAGGDKASLSDYRKRVSGVRNEAIKNRNDLKKELASIQKLLNALGVKPEKDSPPELAEISSKREFYTEKVAIIKAHLAKAGLTLARTEELEKTFSSLGRERLIENIIEHKASPLSPTVIISAVPELFSIVDTIIKSPVEWYKTPKYKITSSSPVLLAMLAAIFIGWFVKKWLLKKFGYDSSLKKPAYARRLLGAFTAAMARGVIPAAIMAAFFYWLSSPQAIIHGLFAEMLGAVLLVFLWLVLVKAFSRVVLNPDLPTWRLTNISSVKASSINYRINLLALLLAVNGFLHFTAGKLTFSEELTSFYTGIITCLELLCILTLTKKWLWERDESEEETPAKTKKDYWLILRSIVKFLALIGAVSCLVGYINFGEFILSRLLFSGGVIGILLLGHGLVHDSISMLHHADFITKNLDVESATLKKVYFWLHKAVEPILCIIGIMVMLPSWGVPKEDVLRWTAKIFTGFSIGEATLSLVDITFAIIVFVGVIALSRLAQRILMDKVLSETSLEKSLQHSLSSGISYIGVIAAFAASIIVVGIDLTNLAMIAGALSVGIGFGLQNVVNNFVSGIIILIERPIKVGDWVVVNGQEGVVKQINIRATELETWQRASIIIPNAEIISNAVTNLTHKDSYGRIEIPIGVAYGSDTNKVKEILFECAKNHADIMSRPEISVEFKNFGDSSLDFKLYCYTSNVHNRRHIASELRFDIDNKFRQENIEIPFPQRVIHMATD